MNGTARPPCKTPLQHGSRTRWWRNRFVSKSATFFASGSTKFRLWNGKPRSRRRFGTMKLFKRFTIFFLKFIVLTVSYFIHSKHHVVMTWLLCRTNSIVNVTLKTSFYINYEKLRVAHSILSYNLTFICIFTFMRTHNFVYNFNFEVITICLKKNHNCYVRQILYYTINIY